MTTAPPVDDYGAPGTPEETRPGLLERTENFAAQIRKAAAAERKPASWEAHAKKMAAAPNSPTSAPPLPTLDYGRQRSSGPISCDSRRR
jgi:hypothetical protein